MIKYVYIQLIWDYIAIWYEYQIYQLTIISSFSYFFKATLNTSLPWEFLHAMDAAKIITDWVASARPYRSDSAELPDLMCYNFSLAHYDSVTLAFFFWCHDMPHSLPLICGWLLPPPDTHMTPNLQTAKSSSFRSWFKSHPLRGFP